MRKNSREAAYKILFASVFYDQNDREFEEDLYKEMNLTQEEIEFADYLLNIVREHDEEIKATISELAIGFKYERLYPADRAAITLGIAELCYTDVPSIVAIDETMNIVKNYSTSESVAFVNGILAACKRKIGK